jgi:hypothetical protein
MVIADKAYSHPSTRQALRDRRFALSTWNGTTRSPPCAALISDYLPPNEPEQDRYLGGYERAQVMPGTAFRS